MRQHRLLAALVAALACRASSSCRRRRRSAARRSSRVFAASSLNTVMPQIDRSEKYSFAGSDALQAQIALGAPADLFLAASTVGPDALYAAGKCQKPVTFVRNRLVLAVPANNPAGITSIYDLREAGRAGPDRDGDGADRRRTRGRSCATSAC